MSSIQLTPCSFSLASSLDDITETKCTFCGFSDWSIVPTDRDVFLNERIANAACVFIASSGSKLVVHLLELLLATNFGLTLNGRIITKNFAHKSPEKEQVLALRLINQDSFSYRIKRGIQTLMSRGHMTSFKSFFSYFKGADVYTVFPLIEKTGLDPFQQTTRSNPRLPFSKVSSSSSGSPTAGDVSSEGTYNFYIFSQETIIFITVIYLTNGTSKALETPFPQIHLTDFLNNHLPDGNYIFRGISSPSFSIPNSLRFEDVEAVSSTTDVVLDSNSLSFTSTVTLNSGTQFKTTSTYPIEKVSKDLFSYHSKRQSL